MVCADEEDAALQCRVWALTSVWGFIPPPQPAGDGVCARITFEPLLEKQRLATSCNHASTVEMHESRHDSFVQSWRQVEVELYVEVVDARVCDCLHASLTQSHREQQIVCEYQGLAGRVHG